MHCGMELYRALLLEGVGKREKKEEEKVRGVKERKRGRNWLGLILRSFTDHWVSEFGVKGKKEAYGGALAQAHISRTGRREETCWISRPFPEAPIKKPNRILEDLRAFIA